MNDQAGNKAAPGDGQTARPSAAPFAVTVVAVYAMLFIPLAEVVVLIAAGGTYLLVGILGAALYGRTHSRWVAAAYFSIEIALGAWIVYLAHGYFTIGLITLPLAGVSSFYLPRRGTFLVCSAILAALMAAYALMGGWETAVSVGLGYLAGIIFVVSSTRLTVREREARAEVERLAAQLSEANRRLQEYTVRAEELATTRERARLAREIHDTLGHTLTALDVQLELLARLPAGQAEPRRRASEQARTLVKDGLADLRLAVQALGPAALETLSLSEAIGALAANFERATHIPTAWQVSGRERPLPARCALPLYRAAQEALTNIQRHAPTVPGVTLSLHYAAESATLTVENARPVSPPPTGETEGRPDGHGLRGLGERAEMLGGAFHAGPDAAGGFRVEMRLPTTV